MNPRDPSAEHRARAWRVLVSILHYNAPLEAAETVRCFRAQTLEHLDLEIVDNRSRPEALAELKRLVPDVAIRALPENLGYTGGNNQGLLRGRAEAFDFVVVANDDIEIAPHALEYLVETAAAHADAGVIGAVEIAHATGQVRAIKGNGFSFWTGRVRWVQEIDLARGPSLDADYVQGALVMFTRAALDAGVTFDENYFMYYDEVDLGFAVKRAGLKAYVDQRVHVRHKNNPLSFNPLSGYFHQRNRVYVVKKYGRWYHRVGYQLYSTAIEVPLKAIVRTVQGRGAFARACVNGHIDGLAGRMGKGRMVRQERAA